MSPPSIQRRAKRATLMPRVKVWLETNDHRYGFGFGISEILQAVERTGSIKHAASALGKSYRHVWGRIKQAEKALGQQLVETQVGGKDLQRSSLTPLARLLVTEFLAVRSEVIRLVEQEFARRFTWPLLASGQEF